MSKLRLRNLAGVLSVPLVIIMAVSIMTAALGLAEESAWMWTRDNPKPAWWRWDKEYETAAPVKGGYMRYAVNKYVGKLNPNHWPVNSWSTISKIYEKMIYNDGSRQPSVPWLAASWEFPTPVTCIMKLRKGVQFTDGTDFDAYSFKYQIDWIMDKNNGCWSKGWLKPVKSIEVLDKYTLKWTFTEPWAAFQGIMATPPGMAISKKALEGDTLLGEVESLAREARKAKKNAAQAGKKAEAASAEGGETARKAKIKAEKAQKKALELAELSRLTSEKAKGIRSTDIFPVTTARYMLEEARPGNYLKIKRNPNWWFGKTIGKPEMPYLDGIILTEIPDPSIQLANMRAGKLDALMNVPPASYKNLLNNPNIVVHAQPGNQVSGLRFNLAKGPCKDILVRKAISHAIDRDALIQGLKFGLATPASCNYPDGHFCKNPDLKPVTFDPELSKRYLAEAGYKNGLEISGYVFASINTNLGTAVQRMLAQVGIKWSFRELDLGAASHAMQTLDYDLGEGGFPDIWDPDPPVTTLYSPKGGFNFGRSHNVKAIALIEAGRQELDIEKRKQIYVELEKVLYDNYEDVWLWYPMNVFAYSKRIKGYNPDLHQKGLEGYWSSHCLWLEDGK